MLRAPKQAQRCAAPLLCARARGGPRPARRTVLDAARDVLALDADHLGVHHQRGEVVVLALVLEVAAVPGHAREVDARAEHDVRALEELLAAHAGAVRRHGLLVPRLHDRERGGPARDLGVAVGHALRAVVQVQRRDEGAVRERADDGHVAHVGAAPAVHHVELVLRRHLGQRRRRVRRRRGGPWRGGARGARRSEREHRGERGGRHAWSLRGDVGRGRARGRAAAGRGEVRRPGRSRPHGLSPRHVFQGT